MRCLIVVSIALLGGCLPFVPPGPTDLLALPLLPLGHGRSTCDDPAVACGSDAAEAAEAARKRNAADQVLIAQMRELTKAADEAAHAKDCPRVKAIQRQVLAFPEVNMHGGFHDGVFLRYPEIVRCLTAYRAYEQAAASARNGQHGDAARQYEAAYETVSDPRLLVMIGAEYETVGNCAAARAYYDQYLEQDNFEPQLVTRARSGVAACTAAIDLSSL